MIAVIKAWATSVGHALRGGATLLRTQPNARIHLVATLVVAVAGICWKISAGEWASLALAFGLVWAAEALNTGLEFLADEVSLERRERIKRAKDVGAFAVLVAALAAVGVGIAVFGPRILG
jgi:diacylglycerol kinase (ATP)